MGHRGGYKGGDRKLQCMGVGAGVPAPTLKSRGGITWLPPPHFLTPFGPFRAFALVVCSLAKGSNE